ncbi:MAG: LysR substrate-binding domain-containing protein [Betaproteobacteria bacterium]|jgi:DNA-binding transcriptional LysR family regulator|nr:LysR family transcriptional regulator [Burkholderiales bacterium]MCA3214151.1 LysR family transcriptional regulator [Burkholderiales bacterium]MCE2643910.1 LysR family transcriptional regulator [Burkholderiaceae bacterium]
MDRLNALEAFVRVVEQGSFVRAAAALGLSTSALSQRVADLESHLGVRLLNRTTRKLSLTESGQALYERAVQVLADLGEAEALASSAAVEPRGTLKITCAHAIGVQRLAPAMAQFHALHPQVRFEVQVSDRMVDLVEEGFDLAIRIGSVVSEQLVARKLGQMRLLPCAAPSYLARHGRPRHPRDLAQHDLLTYAYSRTPQRWVLHGPDGAVHEVRAQGSLNANSGQVLVAAAVAGQGLVLETDFHVGDALARGELVRVLPEYEGGGGDIWAVYPSRRHLSAKLRLFVAHLVQEFAPAPTQRPARAARPPPRHARRR